MMIRWLFKHKSSPSENKPAERDCDVPSTTGRFRHRQGRASSGLKLWEERERGSYARRGVIHPPPGRVRFREGPIGVHKVYTGPAYHCYGKIETVGKSRLGC